MIEGLGLPKSYGKHRVIRDISFDAGQGESQGFLGPNAAGKAPTTRRLTAFLLPTRASAKVTGWTIYNRSELWKLRGVFKKNELLEPGAQIEVYLKGESKYVM